MMKPTTTLWIIVTTAIFASLMLGGYYYWWLKPRLALPNALAKAEQVLIDHQNNLVQSRLVLLELLRLDATSANFEVAQADLLEQLRATHTDSEELLSQNMTNHQLALFSAELPTAISQLRDQHRAVATGHEKLLDTMSNFHQPIAKLYQYNPTVDLGELSPQNDRQVLLARARAAYNGLEEINQSLPATSIREVIVRAQGQLTLLIQAIERGDVQDIETARTNFISQFDEVKTTVLSTQQSFVTSNDTISNLTAHTNVLLAYDFWLAKINEHQAALTR